jgi:NAD(P)-dependent dehydrogenase (short-subunit alcohol dehydrogenase family)
MRLRDKVAIITGAAQGIGAASARLFAHEGARVVVADVQAELGTQVVNAIRDAGGEAIFVRTDVGVEKQVSDLVETTCASYGRIDVLFNNAGIVIPKPLLETNENDLERLLQVNFKGAFYGIKYALPVMMRGGGGSVINNTSSAAVTGRPGMPVYGASKAALLALTRGAAVAYGPSNVRFNAIVPGTIWTAMTESAFRAWSNVEAEKRRTEQVIPLRRIGVPEDIAYTALFLASDESRYVTGVAIPVDGGRTAGIAEAAKAED